MEMAVNMKNISLYTQRDSVIHAAAVTTKLLYIIVVILLPLVVGHPQVYFLTISSSLIFIVIAKVAKQTLPMFWLVSSLVLTLLVFQGIFYRGEATPILQIGVINIYKEGLVQAGKTILMLLNIVIAFAIFVLTTTTTAMTDCLLHYGLSPKFAYVFSSVFQIIPELVGTTAKIMAAQRSRGMRTNGSLIIRARAFFPSIFPIIISSLMVIKERAIALEVRGFNIQSKRTNIKPFITTTKDLLCNIFLVTLLIASIIWRAFLWQ